MTEPENTSDLIKQRWALLLEYDGSAFHGWQKQDNAHSVQDSLENALSRIASVPVHTVCAGRTDKGVHAACQVVHFDCAVERTASSWVKGANAWTEQAVSVLHAWPVSRDFHARFAALSRTYRYIVYNHPVAPTWLRKYVSWYYRPLDAAKMHEAAQYLVGEHDFTSFRASRCQAHSPVRNMHYINIERQGDFIYVELKANAFLYHMVRNIMGVLLAIGNGSYQPEFAGEVLQAKNRSLSLATALPNGLYLSDVEYPAEFAVPPGRALMHYSASDIN